MFLHHSDKSATEWAQLSRHIYFKPLLASYVQYPLTKEVMVAEAKVKG